MRTKLGGVVSLALATAIVFSYQNCSPVHEGNFGEWNERSLLDDGDTGMGPAPDLGPASFTSVHAVMQTYCITCHSSGGQAEEHPFTTYDEVMEYVDASGGTFLGEIYQNVADGSMPREPETMSDSVRESFLDLLFDWIASGAPNN